MFGRLLFIFLLCISFVDEASGNVNCMQLNKHMDSDEVIQSCLRKSKIGGKFDLSKLTDSDLFADFMKTKKLMKMSVKISRTKLREIPLTRKNLAIIANRTEGYIMISRNKNLRSIDLTNMALIQCDHFEISNNPNLVNITFPPTFRIKTNSFYIMNNPRLNAQIVERIVPIVLRLKQRGKEAFVVPGGTCVFREEVRDVSEFEGCSLVYGEEVVFARNAKQTHTRYPPNVQRIHGPVIINDTRLTSLSFLRNAVVDTYIEVTNNRYLCDAEEYILGRGNNVTLRNNCHGVCRNFSHFEQGTNCRILFGDLIIGRNTRMRILELAKKLEKVEGIVRVEDTEIENIDFLANLKSIIDRRALQPVLEIKNNPNLKKIDLSGVEEVRNGIFEQIRIVDNGNFTLTKGEYEKLIETIPMKSHFSIMADVEGMMEEDDENYEETEDSEEDEEEEVGKFYEREDYGTYEAEATLITMGLTLSAIILFKVFFVIIKLSTKPENPKSKSFSLSHENSAQNEKKSKRDVMSAAELSSVASELKFRKRKDKSTNEEMSYDLDQAKKGKKGKVFLKKTPKNV